MVAIQLFISYVQKYSTAVCKSVRGKDFQPDPSSCIYLKEAQRAHAQGYVPTWKRSLKSVNSSIKKHCIYPSCSSNSKLITPSFASTDDLEALFQVQSSEEHPLVLCPKHYHELYHRFNTPLPCASSGVQPKAGHALLDIVQMPAW